MPRFSPPRPPLARATWLALVLAAGVSAAGAAEPASAGHPQQYLEQLTASLAPPARAAMRRIDESERRWLAVRAYLRAGPALEARWSWTPAQIATYVDSVEHQQLLAAIATVRARFERQNPGYSLYANTQTRSLDQQLQRWNHNPGVGAVARHLERAIQRELESEIYPAQPDATAVIRLERFLRTWRPPRAAPLAAPGLSMHGQLRAIDFQVTQGGRVVAAPETATVAAAWEREGWARKLRVAAAGSGFVGPLQSPNEPWHYEYDPARLEQGGAAGLFSQDMQGRGQ